MAEEDRKDRLVEPEAVVEARKYAALAIRLALAATPLTESEVARSMKISTGHLSDVKNGKKFPSIVFLWKFCRATDQSFTDVFTRADAEYARREERRRRVESQAQDEGGALGNLVPAVDHLGHDDLAGLYDHIGDLLGVDENERSTVP